MAVDPSVPEPPATPARRRSNWTSSRGTETVVPWVVTIDLRPSEVEAPTDLPPRPRETTAADEDWMTGCYYF
jgi:hypothetical protein